MGTTYIERLMFNLKHNSMKQLHKLHTLLIHSFLYDLTMGGILFLQYIYLIEFFHKNYFQNKHIHLLQKSLNKLLIYLLIFFQSTLLKFSDFNKHILRGNPLLKEFYFVGQFHLSNNS